jgi:protein-S-isoprenylcysteine O-methyltransferase Ste14
MNAVSFFLYAVLGLYALTLHLEARRTSSHQTGHPPRFAWTLGFFFLNDILLIMGSVAEHQFVPRVNLGVSLAGLGLILLRTRLKSWAMHSLGSSYHVHIVTSPEQSIIRHGPYARVRHPAYTARLLCTLGIPLLMNAYLTLLIMMALDSAAVAARIVLEERELGLRFGPAYRKYQKETGALWPRFRRSLSSRTPEDIMAK